MEDKNSRQGKELKTLNEINEGLGELLGRSSSLVSGEKPRSRSRYADKGDAAGTGAGAQGDAGSPADTGAAQGGADSTAGMSVQGSAGDNTGIGAQGGPVGSTGMDAQSSAAGSSGIGAGAQDGAGMQSSAAGSGAPQGVLDSAGSMDGFQVQRATYKEGTYKAESSDRSDRGLLRQADEITTGTYKKRRPFRLHGAVIFLLVLVLLAGAGAGTVWFLREQGRKSLLEHESIEGVEITAPDDAIIAEDGQIVRYNGKTYRRNTDVISVLCMGIDKDADEVYKDMMDQLEIGEKGQADTIFIAALDTGTGELNLINISRDAMIGVDVYNTDGEYVRTEEMQVCLAYAYGADSESSSRNEMRSVSRLMYGMPMDAYAAIDIPAISVLNDAVGGVQVTVLEDLSSRDPELVKGNVVTLRGNQATTYVRSRDFNALEANNLRMQRQRQYVTAFIRQAMAKARQNISIVLTLYQAVQAYMSTDIDVARLTYLVSLALQREFTDANIMNVAGEVVKGRKFTEYHVNEEALYELILKIYYNEVDDDGNIIIPEAMTEETEIEEPQEQESEKIVTIDRDVLV